MATCQIYHPVHINEYNLFRIAQRYTTSAESHVTGTCVLHLYDRQQQHRDAQAALGADPYSQLHASLQLDSQPNFYCRRGGAVLLVVNARVTVEHGDSGARICIRVAEQQQVNELWAPGCDALCIPDEFDASLHRLREHAQAWFTAQ